MLEVAKQAALSAGKLLLEKFGQTHPYNFHHDWSPSIQADKDSENLIIETIKYKFPSHAIIAEEAGSSGESDYLWVIDPLDGTSNYLRGVPVFGVAIALMHKGSLLLGVNYLPAGNELYWAEKGKGAFLNGQRIRVSKRTKLKESLTFFEGGRDDSSRLRLGEILKNSLVYLGSFKKYGCSVYSLSLIAKGDAEAMIEVNSNLWDIASGIILVEEAGGKVSGFVAEDWTLEVKDLVITNGAIHNEVLKLLK